MIEVSLQQSSPMLLFSMKICSIKNCGRKEVAKGLCITHRMRLERYGDIMVDKPVREIRKNCSVEGCNNKHHCNGLCNKHWKRLHLYGDVNFSKYNRDIFNANKIPEYVVWKSMKSRCFNKNEVAYKNYGGRGITVCERWIEKPFGFKNFMDDMGHRPTEKHQIDRINNDGNYCPENCHWATSKENNNNRRKRNSNKQL